MGFHGRVSRATLADANEANDWRIYADFAQVLIGIARPLHASDPIGVELDRSLYALDSTTIDLCLTLFPWAKFGKHKAAVKMHTLLDLHGNIPTFIRITGGKVADVKVFDTFQPEAGAFYVMDRGYVDFQRLYVFTLFGSIAVKAARIIANLQTMFRIGPPSRLTIGCRAKLPHLAIISSRSAYQCAEVEVQIFGK